MTEAFFIGLSIGVGIGSLIGAVLIVLLLRFGIK